MPLFIIAIIFLIGLLIYVIVSYKTGNYDDTPIRVKFSEKFTRIRTDVNYTVVEDDDDNNSKDSTIIFPTDNVEIEKHKRNIH